MSAELVSATMKKRSSGWLLSESESRSRWALGWRRTTPKDPWTLKPSPMAVLEAFSAHDIVANASSHKQAQRGGSMTAPRLDAAASPFGQQSFHGARRGKEAPSSQTGDLSTALLAHTYWGSPHLVHSAGSFAPCLVN